MKRISIFVTFVLILALTGCQSTKFVPDNEYLLDKVSLKTDTKEVSREELSGYLRQTPNASTFGLFRINLGIYNLSGRDSAGWFNRVLRNMGSPPVIYDPALASISRQQLQLAMQNKGFFNAKVSDTTVYKDKKAKVTYAVRANTPYRLRNYKTVFENEQLAAIAADTARSYIRPNMLFDVDILENERDRIATRFRQTGHYYFTKEALSYIADSTLNSHSVDLAIGLNEEIQKLPETYRNALFRRFTIGNVFFHVNRDFLSANTDSVKAEQNDTVRRGNYFLINNSNKEFIRFNTLILNTSIVPGRFYNDFSVERTYAALNGIPAIKYIDMNFSLAGDSMLNCDIYLSPAREVNFSFETEATYTEGYWGAGGIINTQHKNLFSGAETLTLRGRIAVEKQGKVWAQEYGVQAGLQFPNFLMPFVSYDTKRRIRAKTEFSANMNYQFRPQEYTMTSIGAGLKYLWNWRQSRSTLDLIDLSFVYFPNISQIFFSNYLATGIYNQYNYKDHLIMRLAYSNSYSGFAPSRPLRNFISYNWNIETAGNVLYGISKMFGTKQEDNTSYKVFNIRFAQYIKAYMSVSYNQILDADNRIVYRAALGVAVPYGNADIIPYERRFFSGGANSVRGWSENTLGPGSYQRVTAQGRHDFNQSGDIKLDLNMEVRSKMFWLLEGALFIDAGNIWTVKDYQQQEGGVFDFRKFYRQIASAYGAGLRADFSYFLLRVDLGIKLYDPARDRRSAWRTKPSLKSDMALHLAIGYPF
ncbi:MAG: outer membrane protein assembly factor [Prevotellaceae bacterium]|jgi:hypothetical protein|nr:outer membrane protein assembly factor [Prevotellaceae bacterium]